MVQTTKYPIIIDGGKKRQFDPVTDVLPPGSGGFKDFVESSAVEISSSDTLTTILTLTTPIIAEGNYKIDWSAIFWTSNSNREVSLIIKVDGAQVWEMEQATATSTGRYSVSAQRVLLALTNAAHVITMEYASKDNQASVAVQDRILTMERWA